MNWIQQNKKLAAILGVMIAGALGLGVLLFMAWSDFSSAQAEWATKSQSTTVMESGTAVDKEKVYPSAANVKALDQKIVEYRDKFLTLRKVLLSPSLQQPVKTISETEFQARIKDRAKVVKQKADEAGTKLPANFALGFEEYSDTLPPNADTAAELNVHLDVMERFIMALVGAKVTSLDDLQRSRLPGERPKGQKGGPAAAVPPPQPATAKKGSVPAATVEQVLDRYTIKTIFTTDQGPLQAAMNSLSNAAKTPDFLAVRLMRVENERTEAPTKDEIKNIVRPAPGAAAGEAPAPAPGADGKPAANVIAVVKPMPPDAKAVIGAEALKIYLEVDYIRFRPPAEDNIAAPKR